MMNTDEFKMLYESIREKDLHTRIAQIARFILQENGCSSPSQTMNGTEIFNKCSELVSQIGEEDCPAQSTFLVYLSQAVPQRGTEIFCEGRRKGYYTRPEVGEHDDPACKVEIPAEEKSLYPVFKKWLLEKGYKASDVATSKSNGTWGNPDVVGLKTWTIAGQTEFELVTIECKKSPASWKQWIFEAVAHTRFAHRSYFAFAYPQDEIWKEVDEMLQYAEYFAVGLLVLELPSEAFENYKNGRPTDFSDAEVLELHHAPLHTPQREALGQYLASIDVADLPSLCSFGANGEMRS